MADKISSDRTIRRKPVDRTPRGSDGLPGPSRFHPEPLRTDTHGDHQQQEMSSVLHGSDVARLGVSAVASGVMDSLRRKSQEDMRVRALEEKVKQLELKDQQREADFGHLKAGIGMDQGDRNLMEAHTAFERAGRILAEAKLELRVATDLKNGTWEERENSRIRLHTARSTVGGGIYHTGDIKNASQHAKDERERIEKSIIEDIEKRIGKVNERRKDTIDDKKKAETLAQDAKLAHETQQAWKKTDETLGKVVDTDVKTETVLQDARKLAEEARVLWSRVRDTWEQALGSDTISAMSDLSLRTQWMNSPQKKSIDDIYDKRIKAISEKGNKAIQNLDSTHASEIADMNKYKKILSKKSIEKQYNKQRDALILKYDRQRDAVYKEQALALQQAQIEFEKKGDKLSPKLPDIPERGGLKESLAASRRPPTAQLYSKGGESSTSAARRPQEDLRKPISGPTPRRKSAYSQSRQKDSDSDDDSLYARPRKRSESTTMPTKPPVEQPFAQEGELNKHPAKEQPDASHQPISGPTPRRKYNVQPVDYANYSRSDDDDLYTPGPPLQHIERPTTSKSPPIEQRDKESRTTVRRQSDATKTETPDKQAPKPLSLGDAWRGDLDQAKEYWRQQRGVSQNTSKQPEVPHQQSDRTIQNDSSSDDEKPGTSSQQSEVTRRKTENPTIDPSMDATDRPISRNTQSHIEKLNKELLNIGKWAPWNQTYPRAELEIKMLLPSELISYNLGDSLPHWIQSLDKQIEDASVELIGMKQKAEEIKKQANTFNDAFSQAYPRRSEMSKWSKLKETKSKLEKREQKRKELSDLRNQEREAEKIVAGKQGAIQSLEHGKSVLREWTSLTSSVQLELVDLEKKIQEGTVQSLAEAYNTLQRKGKYWGGRKCEYGEHIARMMEYQEEHKTDRFSQEERREFYHLTGQDYEQMEDY